MSEAHWPAVAQIYKQGVDTGFATFEKEIPSYEQWNKNHISSCRLVALRDHKIVGWAALSPVLWKNSLPPAKRPGSGRFNRAFFLKIKPASNFMKKLVFAFWADVNE